MNSLLADVRQELLDGIKTDLDLARLHNWDSKKTKEVLDKRFTKAENRSVSIARTETMFVYNSFIENRARKDGVENLIWITANDELVCTVCGLNHLKAFPINNLPDLPAHTHCRCSWMIPMTRD
jgi:SPP1 gp7 family putative phage head morphogenesis protein